MMVHQVERTQQRPSNKPKVEEEHQLSEDGGPLDYRGGLGRICYHRKYVHSSTRVAW